MATLVQTTNAQGDLILTAGKTKYIFREPVGRDLISLEQRVKAGDSTDAETLAAIMSQQSRDGHDTDYFLDLPLATFRAIGDKMLVFFRPSDNETV